MHEFVPEEYVFHAVFAVVQRKILIYRTDAERHRFSDCQRVVFLTADGDDAAVWADSTGEYFDECGLAGTVVADNGGDSTVFHGEGNGI